MTTPDHEQPMYREVLRTFASHPVGFEDAQRQGMLRAFGYGSHDGDTITVFVDLGFTTYTQLDIRIVAASGPIDTPEIVGTTGDVLARARAAHERTADLTENRALLLRTHRTRKGEPLRTFARYVAEVYTVNAPYPIDVGQQLLDEGLADRLKL